MFLSVYRVRSCDPNDDARSDEDFSDKEIVLTEAQLEQALKTRVGGRITDKTKENNSLEAEQQFTRTHIVAKWHSHLICGLPEMTDMHNNMSCLLLMTVM